MLLYVFICARGCSLVELVFLETLMESLQELEETDGLVSTLLQFELLESFGALELSRSLLNP